MKWVDVDGAPLDPADLEPTALERAAADMLHAAWDTDEEGYELLRRYETALRADIAARIRASKNERGYFYNDEIGNAQYEADRSAREDAACIAEGDNE